MPTDDLAVEGRLKGYIESVRGTQLEHEPADLVGKHLVNDLSMDSLDIMNLLFQIEENERAWRSARPTWKPTRCTDFRQAGRAHPREERARSKTGPSRHAHARGS